MSLVIHLSLKEVYGEYKFWVSYENMRESLRSSTLINQGPQVFGCFLYYNSFRFSAFAVLVALLIRSCVSPDVRQKIRRIAAEATDMLWFQLW